MKHIMSFIEHIGHTIEKKIVNKWVFCLEASRKILKRLQKRPDGPMEYQLKMINCSRIHDQMRNKNMFEIFAVN